MGKGCRARIFHINDVYLLDNLASLKCCVEKESSDLPPSNVITVLAGDFLAPSLLSSLDHGISMVDMMNRVPVDVVCFGNHEADVPYVSLKHRIREYNGVWLNSNMPGWGTLEDEPHCPENHLFEFEGGRSVAMIGLNVGGGENASLYREGAFGGHAETIVPVLEAVDGALAKAKAKYPSADLIIPLTHQSIPDDVKLAQRGLVPLILGGHDHCEYDETFNGCRVLKAGEDAKNVIIVDLFWPEEAPQGSPPEITVTWKHLVKPKQKKGEPPVEWTQEYPPCEKTAAAADRWMGPAKELMVATLEKVPLDGPPLTSVGVRKGPSSMATLIATAMRDAVGADACFVNSGAVRAKKTYTDGIITYADLSAECPFPTINFVIKVMGSVMSEALAASRVPWPEEFADALQCDDGITVDEGHRILTVKGEAFDPDKMYLLLCDTYMCGANTALNKWVTENPALVPPEDAGFPALPILVRYFCDKAWRGLSDLDGDGVVTRDEIDAFFEQADSDCSGGLCEGEILRALEERIPHMASNVVAKQMMILADKNCDGRVSRDELVDVMIARLESRQAGAA